MQEKGKLDWLKALLVSRKFWTLSVVAIGAVVLYIQGAIDAEALVTALVALGGFLVTTIAAEDVAEKVGAARAVAVEKILSVGEGEADVPPRWREN